MSYSGETGGNPVEDMDTANDNRSDEIVPAETAQEAQEANEQQPTAAIESEITHPQQSQEQEQEEETLQPPQPQPQPPQPPQPQPPQPQPQQPPQPPQPPQPQPQKFETTKMHAVEEQKNEDSMEMTVSSDAARSVISGPVTTPPQNTTTMTNITSQSPTLSGKREAEEDLVQAKVQAIDTIGSDHQGEEVEDADDEERQLEASSSSRRVGLSDPEKMRRLLGQFSTSQSERYEAYRRSAFAQGTVKKMMGSVSGESINKTMAIIMCGITKVFVGELVEEAREYMDQREETGPIRPHHIREAYRRLGRKGKIPYLPKPAAFQRR